MSKIDVKVVLLGKEYGGKTSLVERYINQRFTERPAHRYQATIGAAYASKKIPTGTNTVTMGIWDTAGSERYEAMSRMYYRNAKAAIVCYDLTDFSSFERCKFWIQELQKSEETCKIYLCGTKLDLVTSDESHRKINRNLILNYASDIGATVFETSSKTGEGVEELFTQIVEDYNKFEMEAEEPHTRVKYDSGKKFCCFG